MDIILSLDKMYHFFYFLWICIVPLTIISGQGLNNQPGAAKRLLNLLRGERKISARACTATDIVGDTVTIENDVTAIADDEYKATAIKNAEDNMKSIINKKPFKRCYSDIEETFRTKKTGNKVLGFVCSFCPYKLPCWGSKLQLLPQQQSQGKNPKWVWYTEVNNPKQDKALANDGG